MATDTLDCFPKLLQDNTNIRINGGLKLIQQLSREIQEKNEESKEVTYALNRLVRGLGSSKIHARKGFYATLTTFLKINPTIKLEQILNTMDKELKATGSSSKGEHADVYHGRTLVCGALIRSKILNTCSLEEQKKVLECLLQNGKQKDYLYYEAISFIQDFLKQLEDNSTISVLKPLLEEEICKPFSEQNLDTFHLLLIVQNLFPDFLDKKTIKNCFGSDKIICKDNVKEIAKILTNTPRTVYYKHPVHQLFCEMLISKGKQDLVKQFWEAIDECFNAQTHKLTKTEKFMAVQLFKLLLENYEKYIEKIKCEEFVDKKIKKKNISFLSSLLSNNFLKYLLKRFKMNPIKNDEIAIEFQKALTLFVKVLDLELGFYIQNSIIDKKEETKLRLDILKKLIFYPGDIMIEKLTGTKVFQTIMCKLDTDGVKELSELFRDIASNTKFKEKPDSEPESWRFDERIYVMQIFSVKLLNHSEVIKDYDWRLEQLKFLFNLGLCETNIEQELLSQYKECFYRALDHKFPKLDDLRNVLKSLINFINDTVFTKTELKLRKPLSEKAQEAWEKMLRLNKKLEKNLENKDKIKAVFHTMNLHMGLQLFLDQKMAKEAIDDIYSSYENLKSKNKSSNKNDNEENNEPIWVEVVVDLLLLLLSKKSHLLRSLVNCVFPHMCPHLTSVAVHSILETLDPNGNPFVTNEDEDSKDELSCDDEDNEEDEDDDDEKEDEITEIDSESDIEDDSGSEDETMTDVLRSSIQKILYKDAMQTDNDEIDVDEIDETEGKKLDAQLAAAFKMIKETRKSSSKKQKESDQVLMHYRIRVMDLLEMYMESGPSMALALDMLVPIFQLLEFCIKDPHQKPLENRVRACMKKLSTTKKFESVEGVDENALITTLKVMMQESKLTASVSKEMGDKLADCCIFLIRCSQLSNTSTDAFVQIFVEYLTLFFEKRSCIMQPIFFMRLLQLYWTGTWKLAPLLVNFAFDENIRSFKRGQAFVFLKTFYNNQKMINSDEHKKERLKMEKKLYEKSIKLLKSIKKENEEEVENQETSFNVEKEIKQKYICHLFTLLLSVYQNHLPTSWDWIEMGKAMACYRATVSLAKDAKSAYNKLAQRIGAPDFNKNERKSNKVKHQNGHQETNIKEKTLDDGKLVNGQSNNVDEQIEKTNDTRKKDKKKNKKNKEPNDIDDQISNNGIVIQNGVHNESLKNDDDDDSFKKEKVNNKRSSSSNDDTSDVILSKKKRKSFVKSGD